MMTVGCTGAKKHAVPVTRGGDATGSSKSVVSSVVLDQTSRGQLEQIGDKYIAALECGTASFETEVELPASGNLELKFKIGRVSRGSECQIKVWLQPQGLSSEQQENLSRYVFKEQGAKGNLILLSTKSQILSGVLKVSFYATFQSKEGSGPSAANPGFVSLVDLPQGVPFASFKLICGIGSSDEGIGVILQLQEGSGLHELVANGPLPSQRPCAISAIQDTGQEYRTDSFEIIIDNQAKSAVPSPNRTYPLAPLQLPAKEEDDDVTVIGEILECVGQVTEEGCEASQQRGAEIPDLQAIKSVFNGEAFVLKDSRIDCVPQGSTFAMTVEILADNKLKIRVHFGESAFEDIPLNTEAELFIESLSNTFDVVAAGTDEGAFMPQYYIEFMDSHNRRQRLHIRSMIMGTGYEAKIYLVDSSTESDPSDVTLDYINANGFGYFSVDRSLSIGSSVCTD